MIEVLDDILEELADQLGVYGSHEDQHPKGTCRVCWVSSMKSRIKYAIKIERKLAATGKEQKG